MAGGRIRFRSPARESRPGGREREGPGPLPGSNLATRARGRYNASREVSIMNETDQPRLVRVRPGEDAVTRNRLNYFIGISENTAGSHGISMNIVRVPPGAKTDPHYHADFEAAIYVLEGEVETRFGDGYTEKVVTVAGDFLYIPPGVPHQTVNLSDTKEAAAIIARTTARENENTVPCPPPGA